MDADPGLRLVQTCAISPFRVSIFPSLLMAGEGES